MSYFQAMLTSLLLGIPAVLLFSYWGYNLTDFAYTKIYGRPLVVYNHFHLRNLYTDDIIVLYHHSPFYNRLDAYKKQIFKHRLSVFMESKEFIGLDGFEFSRDVKVTVSSIAVMLSFGMRNYLIESVKKIIIDPVHYYSSVNQDYHLWEYNPALKTIVLSWPDFVAGICNENDNISLGVHVFAHALFFGSMQSDDNSSLVFCQGIKKIDQLLNQDDFRKQLKRSKYLRAYALTNKFEFFAVCLEHFIESPKAFKEEFSELFIIIKEMMNFELHFN